ncbi:prephenate dehydrogenase [Bacillus sp. FJAT-29790]|uniref:prephenate dehydrogenase n=1 Tax=Bacillus sp. FJAT-29790 TaxID=1895002 RepID=UPI001C237869|nr:prephenate dehydrogenase [Bacillus sp. FJAT-29790]MBU8879092.1 prephenate dehydrogenase [Bacillus sp. FJAT-29790]
MEGRVFVIGLGLIGGSLALCIKKTHEDAIIIGYDVNEKQTRLAKMLGVVDETADSIEEGAQRADLILIATPVKESERILGILEHANLKKEVIISDAGSTKKEIVQIAGNLKQKGITFIGGHPMAGSHKSGVAAAKSILFENAFYLLTPEEHIHEEQIHQLQEWLAGTKARFLKMTPDEHDYLTGVISHFPHVIAASLVHQAEKSSETQKLIPRLAAGGFRDVTRIASSSPEMWRDILLHNKEVLLHLLANWQEEMGKVAGMLESENSEEIFDYFYRAKQFRDELPQKQRGAIPAFYDLFVDVPDYPGVISEITGLLAKEEISITNIRIRETRVEIYGILVISFQTEEDRDRAALCIHNHTSYETTIGL